MPYEMVLQPNPTLPVYKVKPEGTRSPLQIVHRDMLRPCTFVPRKPKAERGVGNESETVAVEDDLWVLPPTADPRPLEQHEEMASPSEEEMGSLVDSMEEFLTGHSQ